MTLWVDEDGSPIRTAGVSSRPRCEDAATQDGLQVQNPDLFVGQVVGIVRD